MECAQHTLCPGPSKVALGVLSFFAVVLSQGLPNSRQGYALQIELAGSSGSGFLTQDRARLYLVTARHVLFKDSLAQQLVAEKATVSGREDERPFALTVDVGGLWRGGLVRADMAHDVAVVYLARKPDSSSYILDSRYVKANDKIDFTISAIWWTSLRKYDSVQVGADVYVFGYPTSIGLKRSPQIDYNRPLIQKGIVAGLNPNRRTIVLNVASNFGNSGGPAVELELSSGGPKFVPIGIVTEYIPFEEVLLNVTRKWSYSTITSSPYSIAEPLDPVIDIIKSWK